MIDDRGACWRCKSFDRDADDPEDGGYCRRYPPTVVITDDGVMTAFPGVDYTDWCSEFVESE